MNHGHLSLVEPNLPETGSFYATVGTTPSIWLMMERAVQVAKGPQTSQNVTHGAWLW
jgi:hypothetical protein